MQLDETLIFVDGENLTLRYQELLRDGHSPAAENVHLPDVFIWSQRVLEAAYWNLKRISYYTSVAGDDPKVREVRNRIGQTQFTCKTGIVSGPLSAGPVTRTGQLMPFVRKRSARSRKQSICDIQLAVDVMRACYRDHAKIIWVFTGDGDFLSLFEEVAHSGKTIYASAFSSGLNEDIPYVVDEFVPLDQYFFVSKDKPKDDFPNPPAGAADAQPLA
jgi:uncharacterized LabA/DUF88 family protein